MRHRERLEDTADRLSGLGTNKEVEVVGHEAVAEQPEGVATLGAIQGSEEGVAVGLVGENVATVISAIEGVVDQAVVDSSW